jgi:hypothetical protein
MAIAVIPENNVATTPAPTAATGMSLYGSRDSYRMALDAAAKLSASKIVPEAFKDDPGACLIAIDTASRMDIPLLMVLQNLYIVKGKPSWSGSFVIARLNSCGRFTPLDFVMEGDCDTLSCYVQTVRRSDGRTIKGTTITMEMARAEGWLGNAKWKNMREQMICYRAASFFGRVHAPDVILGMHTTEEVEDVVAEQWGGAAQPTPARAEIVRDPLQDRFDAALMDGTWTKSQRTQLATRWSNGDAESRLELVVGMEAQLAPRETKDESQGESGEADA